MSAGTKIFLALFGLFVLLLVFYYGLWSPGDPDDALSLNLDNQSETMRSDPSVAPARVDNTDSSANRSSRRPLPANSNNSGIFDPAVGPVGDRPGERNQPVIEMGGNIGQDGPVAANRAMDIGADAPASSEVHGRMDEQLPEVSPPRKNVELVPVAQYFIEDGDTLSNIASRWFGDSQKWDLILAVNPGLDADALRIGQAIKLPSRDAQRPARSGAVITTQTTAETSYIVKSDDSLSTIAKAHYGKASKWILIYEANRTAIGPNPDVLREGMTLLLPPG